MLLVVAVILTVTISATQNAAASKLNATQVSVLPAMWFGRKPMAGQAMTVLSMRYPLPMATWLSVPPESIVPNATVGWALKLDGEGNAVWNQHIP